MGAHPMVPAEYTTPETIRALDDATRVGGAIAGILAAAIAAHVGFRRWWHRKRNRQERVLREEMAALRDSLQERLDEATGALGQRPTSCMATSARSGLRSSPTSRPTSRG